MLMRQTGLFLALVLGAVVAIFIWGLPLLVKLAIFLGDVKSSSEKVEQTDTVPPIAPRLLPLSTATFSAQVKIEGFSESGSKVTVYVNSVSRGEVVTDSNGNFSLDRVSLNLGKNGIWASAIDAAGNKSQDSEVTYVDMDDTKPQLIIDTPQDQATTSDAIIEVKGRVSKTDAEVTVNDRLVIVSGGGTFSAKVAVDLGDNKLTIKAVDRAGNQAGVELTVKRE